MWTFALMLTALAPQAAPAGAAPPPAEQQIAAAILAAPEERRTDATVLGYDTSGSLVTLRKGTGDLICLSDDPKEADFDVACYQKDLEPFMARGRELHAKGVGDKERNQMRWKEVDAGTLKMPREPHTLYILTGTAYDAATGTVTKAYRRYVVYIPYATAESTGLSTMPVPGGPWLMFAGTAGAHIMINPAKDK
jgi:hypothetical protein